MNNSFLFPFPLALGEVSNSITELHIDYIIKYILDDKRKQNYILDTLALFDNNLNNIRYRQEIIKDVIKYPRLINELNNIYSKLEVIFETHKNLKYQFNNFKSEYEIPKAILNDAMNDFSYLLLEVLKVYQDYANVLNKYKFNSEGFNHLKDMIIGKVETSAFTELKEYFDYFLINSSEFEIEVNNDDDLFLRSVKCLERIQRKYSFFKKDNDSLVVLNSVQTQALYRIMYTEARLSLSNLFEELYNSLFNPLYSYKDEIIFLEFGLKLSEFFKRINMEYCFPEVNTENKIIINQLSDLYLSIKGLEESYRIYKVYPNDCIIENSDAGRLIFGENNTGKTVYIRSIAIAQIFMQAGLMVAGSNANISIKEKLLTFLSSKELNTTAGGRFEKEVSIISNIINSVDKNSMIIMNEIFQSTSVDEGSDALYNILSFFTKKEATWFAVTHLRQILEYKEKFKLETKKNFLVLMSSLKDNKYSINEIKNQS